MARKMIETKSATMVALLSSVSLAAPAPLWAQDAQAQPAETCADGSAAPCAAPEAQPEAEAPADADAAPEATPEASPEGAPEAAAEEPAAEAAPDAAAEQPAAEEPAAESEPETATEQPATEQPAEPQAEPAPAETREAEQPAPEAAPAPATEEPAPESGADSTADTSVTTEGAGAAAGSDATAEAPATAPESGQTEQAAEPAAEPTAEPSAEAAPSAAAEETGSGEAQSLDEAMQKELSGEAADAEPAAKDAPADSTAEDTAAKPAPKAATEAESAADGTTAAETKTETNAEATDETAAGQGAAETGTADGAATAESDAQAETVAAEDRPAQPEAESGAPPVAAALAASEEDAAAGSAEAKADGEVKVSEEKVTDESARSSDEDFQNRVNERLDELEDAQKDAKKDDKGGIFSGALSNREKLLLGGLGLAAVGTMLSNNRQVELNSGDRLVVTRPDGGYQVIKDDGVLLRRPGSDVRTETFRDGSSRTYVTRADGSQIVTVYDPEMRVVRRSVIQPSGERYMLIDDSVAYEPVDVSTLPRVRPQYVSLDASQEELRRALAQEAEVSRSFSLGQVRNIYEVRSLVPVIDVNAITFDTGSSAIKPDQAKALASLGKLIRGYIDENPREVFLIEGHTDAVGSAASNLALSDRRAESVALALTEYFEVPPENMVVQGYGEENLRVQTDGDERANRRAAVRRITDLLNTAQN